jgi:hypothetical protein
MQLTADRQNDNQVYQRPHRLAVSGCLDKRGIALLGE